MIEASAPASDSAPTEGPTPKARRVPLRRRPMPCPHCDLELPRALASESDPSCPGCGASLTVVRVAGFWRRALAALLDAAVLALTAGPIAWGLHALMNPEPLAPGARGLGRLLTIGATDLDVLLLRIGPFTTLVAIYYLFSVLWAAQTPGQRLLAMHIVDRHGRPPGPLAAIVRTLTQIAGTLAAVLGPLWIAFDTEKRAIHDIVAGTYVVRSA